jgi:hypothetical protein
MIRQFLELHPPSEYALVWKQVEGVARFTHRVIACSEPEALRSSRSTMSRVFGENRQDWKIASVRSRWKEREPRTDVVETEAPYMK